jgi:Carboxypeptidase regulatory-like domain
MGKVGLERILLKRKPQAPRNLVRSPVVAAGRWTLVFLFLLAFLVGQASEGIAGQTPPTSMHGIVKATTPDKQVFTVEGARLELDGSAAGLPSYSAFSNQDGAFSFAAVQPGTYTLRVASTGFKKFSRPVTVEPGRAANQDVLLEFEAVRQEVEVHENAPKVSQESTAPPATLSAPRLKTVPTTQAKYKEALPFVPSVVRTQDEKIYIKGTSENQGMLLTDTLQAVDPVSGAFVIDVPLDAIDSLEVFKAPYRTEYGGFAGGMTSIHTKPPASQWSYSMHDVNPSIRGREGHMVGFAKAEPRLYFSGPLLNKLSFSEAFMYEMRKEPIRGLAWPHNEVKTQGFNSFTTFQYLFSPTHLTLVRVNIFPRRQQFANINSLISQSASADYGLRGYSIGVADSYQFASGGLLSSQIKVTRNSTNAHGQGSNDMLVTPNGFDGSYFNTWDRDTHQEEALETFEFPMKERLGKHRVKIGVDYLHRSFDGFSRSHPVLLLGADDTVAERIDFIGPGLLAASDTQFSAFAQNHWAIFDRFALDLGVRYFGQSSGESGNIEPRLGFVFSPDREGKTIFRGGIGLFDDRVPLLAADFADNPTRVVSIMDPQGGLVGSPKTFTNACAQKSELGPRILTSCSDLGSNPYNATWNVQADRRLGSNVLVRVGYLSSRTYNTFVLDPVDVAGANPMLLLSNRGSARYHEYEASVRFRTGERSDLTVSYVHGRSRGDLNNVNDLFVPFEQPVIRPNLYGNLPSDVPDRVTALGNFKLPKDFTLVPAFDLHSGFAYSNLDVLQNYVGSPNSQRFPIYFSVDWRIYRDFPLPFGIHKGHKFRLGVYSVNTTGRKNPHDVYSNIASPLFGNFAGLGKRINGIVIGFAE